MKTIYLSVLFLLASLVSYADGYWLELTGSGKVGDTVHIRIRYGGVDEQKNRYIKSGTDLDKMKGFELFSFDATGHKKIIPIQQYDSCWAGYFIPSSDGQYTVLAKNETLPVVERPDSLQNIKPVQYLCASYNVGINSQQLAPVQYLDIRVTLKKNTIIAHPFIQQQPVVKGTKLRIFYPDNHDEPVTVDNEGKAVVNVITKGLYLVRLDWVDHTPGSYKGKKYYAIRHRCDYAVEVK